MNFHEPLEIKSDFQRPSSSESPLLIWSFWTKFGNSDFGWQQKIGPLSYRRAPHVEAWPFVTQVSGVQGARGQK